MFITNGKKLKTGILIEFGQQKRYIPLVKLYRVNFHLFMESNLMHEIAHVLFNHKPVGFDSVTGLPKRKQNNEYEATYLGRCPQIPKSGLLWATQRKMLLPHQIAAHFGASEAMVKFRTNVTEVSVKC